MGYRREWGLRDSAARFSAETLACEGLADPSGGVLRVGLQDVKQTGKQAVLVGVACLLEKRVSRCERTCKSSQRLWAIVGLSPKWHLGLEFVLWTHSSPAFPASAEELHSNRLLHPAERTSLPLSLRHFFKGRVTQRIVLHVSRQFRRQGDVVCSAGLRSLTAWSKSSFLLAFRL